MKKSHLILTSLIMLLVVLFGCSKKELFNDENIIFNVVNIHSANESYSYTIEISNKTGLDLTHLTFNLSFPIKTSNGSKGNPFVVEGEADNSTRPVNLKSGETTKFSIFAPINEVFSDTDLLDFENPSIELKGYFKEGNNEIPFGMSGGLSFFVDRY
ncbi:hypothetical protein M3936_08635 [Sutcliffiella horikoshii]|uniref:hypothetical protein n=1 Tax=Sutcliffiella horikoshii TaxID=79883 RepID=UPI00203A643A|nr:hypothetical protein [Sutcliffiella horikoshii]MCM3617646.1 hypothetical protein [Sutcliffiella horikoshii]